MGSQDGVYFPGGGEKRDACQAAFRELLHCYSLRGHVCIAVQYYFSDGRREFLSAMRSAISDLEAVRLVRGRVC